MYALMLLPLPFRWPYGHLSFSFLVAVSCCDCYINVSIISEPRDCKDLHRFGSRRSGVYTIYPGNTPKRVYCDMDTVGGGWTVRCMLIIIFVP